jgi:radical SAM protein (TIGR01212 family)
MFIAYFQDCTPTNCTPRQLEPKLEEALAFPGVAGVALCTRPDCLPDGMVAMMGRIASRTLLWVELGLQSSSDATLQRVNRNSTAADCARAACTLREAGIRVCLHVILGLPGETQDDMARTADFVKSCNAWGVKIHNLHILRGTAMEIEYSEGRTAIPSMEEYASMAAAFLSRLGPGIVVHRIVGDAPAGLLVAPSWMRDKQAVIRAVEQKLRSGLRTLA